MRRLNLFLVVLLFIPLASAQSISPAQLPPAFNASYDLLKKGLPIAETQYQFSKNSTSALFNSNTQLTGMAAWFSDEQLSESSQFEFSNNQVRVVSYQYHQTGKKALSINSIFNKDKENIVTRINQQTAINTDYQTPVWDKLSMLIVLMASANHENKSLQFNAIDNGEIKSYQLSKTGVKEIELDEDNWIKTIRWQRINKNRKTVFYLDPKQHFLPVKIEQYKRDKRRATLLLKEIQWHQPAKQQNNHINTND